jgi:hypothetical protein
MPGIYGSGIWYCWSGVVDAQYHGDEFDLVAMNVSIRELQNHCQREPWAPTRQCPQLWLYPGGCRQALS